LYLLSNVFILIFFQLNIRFWLGIMLIFLAQTCSIQGLEENTGTEQIRINHYKQSAFGMEPMLVMLVQEGDDIGSGRWENFYDNIAGFDYESGYIYQLKVRKKKVKNPPQDASSVQFTLVKVISKEAVNPNEDFTIKLKWENTNFAIADANGQYSLLSEYDIDCNSLCDALTSALDHNEEVTGTFIHGQDGSLILKAID